MQNPIPFFTKSYARLLLLILLILVSVWLVGYWFIGECYINQEEIRLRAQLLFTRATLIGAFISYLLIAFKYRSQLLTTTNGTAINLSFFRLIYFGFFTVGALFFLPKLWAQTMAYLELPDSAMIEVLFMDWLPYVAPHTSWLVTLAVVLFFIAILCSFVGFKTKWAILLFVLCGFYLFGIPNFYGKINHNHHILWFAVILAFSPCEDRWSVDAWLRKKRGKAIKNRATFAYQIPFIMIWCLMGIIYFFPGFWKLWISGLDWALTDNMRNQMNYKWMQLDGWMPWFRLDHYPFLYRSLGLFVLIFEVFFIGFVLHYRTRLMAILGGLLFHFGSWLFMDIFFVILVLAYSSFVPWDRIFFKDKGVESVLLPIKNLNGFYASNKMLCWVGAILIGGNTLFGIAHWNSWPFTVYPTFETMLATSTEDLVYRGLLENGTSVPLSKSPLIAHFSSERFWAMEEKIKSAHKTSSLSNEQDLLGHLCILLRDSNTNIKSVIIELEQRSLDTVQVKEVTEYIFVKEIRLDSLIK